MDPGEGGRRYPRAVRGGISFRPRVVDLAPETRLELPAAGRTSPRAKRGRHPRLERKHLAGPQKKAQKEGRIIVFVDESGLSQRPHRVSTWFKRGVTPILQHQHNGNHRSIAAG